MIRCVAIDDEPIALSIIREYCSRYGDMELQTFTSPVAGMECVAATRPDIVFMDIEMNSHNGVELAKSLPEGVCLIFTTAYSQYAIDGFNVDAVDFLHKPIFYQRFARAMEKARKWLGRGSGADSGESITLKVEHRNVVVRLEDISFIEAMDNYVKVFRKNMPMVLSQITMKEMEDKLPAAGFVRVHRSYIISLGEVESFTSRKIKLHKIEEEIPVGRKYSASFSQCYDKYKLKKTEL